MEHFRPDWDEDWVWSVFATDGSWLGTVATPPYFTISEIGSDYLLGVHRDELGVERVRRYRLVKP